MTKWFYITVNGDWHILGIELEIKEKGSRDSALNEVERRQHDNPKSHVTAVPLMGVEQFLKQEMRQYGKNIP